jgi:gas vesicle structural protein
MSVMQQPNRYLDRPAPSSLADVIDTILDKGLVIDVYVRVSLVGIELLTIDARIVIASVDTYLRFATAVNRLDITQDKEGLPELLEGVTESASKSKTSGALDAAGEKLAELFGGGGGEEEEEEEQRQPKRRPARSSQDSGQRRRPRRSGEGT